MSLFYSFRKLIRQVRIYPWNKHSFNRKAEPGLLISELFEKIKHIPGWFNVDDCVHFYLILEMQSHLGVTGDLLEIGSYFGRSAAMLGYCIKSEEKLVVCDAFQGGLDYTTGEHPSPEVLIRNVQKVAPNVDRNRIVIHATRSEHLELKKSRKLRFAHVDGGHSKAECLHDLESCAPHMISHGVIAVDDYAHYRFPGVVEAVETFRRHHPEYYVLADLNRHGAAGRKIYLQRN